MRGGRVVRRVVVAGGGRRSGCSSCGDRRCITGIGGNHKRETTNRMSVYLCLRLLILRCRGVTDTAAPAVRAVIAVTVAGSGRSSHRAQHDGSRLIKPRYTAAFSAYSIKRPIAMNVSRGAMIDRALKRSACTSIWSEYHYTTQHATHNTQHDRQHTHSGCDAMRCDAMRRRTTVHGSTKLVECNYIWVQHRTHRLRETNPLQPHRRNQ